MPSLEQLARTWLADETAPDALQRRTVARLTPRRRWLRPTLAVGSFAALATTAAIVVPPLVRPPLAFAQVEAALANIKLAQWHESITVTQKDGKHIFIRRTYTVRTNPMALESHPDPRSSVPLRPIDHYIDEHELWTLTEHRTYQPSQQRLGIAPLDTLRQVSPHFLHARITGRIFAPGQSKSQGLTWKRSEMIWQGRRVIRFDNIMPRFNWHMTVLADPTTHRILRSNATAFRTEEQERTEIICDQYRFDDEVKLSRDTFTLEPPPDTKVGRDVDRFSLKAEVSRQDRAALETTIEKLALAWNTGNQIDFDHLWDYTYVSRYFPERQSPASRQRQWAVRLQNRRRFGQPERLQLRQIAKSNVLMGAGLVLPSGTVYTAECWIWRKGVREETWINVIKTKQGWRIVCW